MNLYEYSEKVATVTDNFRNIKMQLQMGQSPSPFKVQFVSENIKYLTQAQKEEFFNIIVPKVRQMSSIDNALMVKKNNVFLRLPIIRDVINNMKDKKRTKMIQDMRIKEGIPDDKVEKMKDEEKQKYFKRETLVVSDLHSKIDQWEHIKREIIENPFKNFVILGDAMDRGEYGLEMLLEIKELSDIGRIQYLPGNHDHFAYQYIMCKGRSNDKDVAIFNNAKKSLEVNKGIDTIEKIENFSQVVQEALAKHMIRKPITLQELANWLGEQPIQRVIYENQTNYALAHAMFDTRLYNADRKFNLRKALELQRRER